MVGAKDRVLAVRSLLYLCMGNYEPGLEQEDLFMASRENVFLLLDLGQFGCVCVCVCGWVSVCGWVCGSVCVCVGVCVGG